MDSEQVYFVIKHLMQSCETTTYNCYFRVYHTGQNKNKLKARPNRKDIQDIKSSAIELKNHFPKEIFPQIKKNTHIIFTKNI